MVAVDGRNMVVVVQEGDWGSGSPVFILFYTLENDGWQRANAPIRVDDVVGAYEVALSGTTTFVGFQYANGGAGTVGVYEQDQFRGWDKVEDPFIHDANASHVGFGMDVEIDGDLACVEEVGNVYLFHQESTKWVQFDMIAGASKCSISGDTIATWEYDSELDFFLQLYKYDQDLGEVVSNSYGVYLVN